MKATVVELKNGKIKRYKIDPDKLGLEICFSEELKGGNP